MRRTLLRALQLVTDVLAVLGVVALYALTQYVTDAGDTASRAAACIRAAAVVPAKPHQ